LAPPAMPALTTPGQTVGPPFYRAPPPTGTCGTARDPRRESIRMACLASVIQRSHGARNAIPATPQGCVVVPPNAVNWARAVATAVWRQTPGSEDVAPWSTRTRLGYASCTRLLPGEISR